MPRVVPSQVHTFIQSFPQGYILPTNVANMNILGSGRLRAVVHLAEEIPNELLTMDAATYASFVQAKAEIRDTLDTWIGNTNANVPRSQRTYSLNTDPIRLIRDALAVCPDQSPAPATIHLNFITDPDLRTNLRNDIGAINVALSNGEWKPATILAGATIEALLLWDLQNRRAPASVAAAIPPLLASGTLHQQPPANLDQWNLHQLIEVSTHLGTLQPATVIEARLAKDFRNLIHPGRTQRLGQICDRGTALASVAALEHVVRDLT